MSYRTTRSFERPSTWADQQALIERLLHEYMEANMQTLINNYGVAQQVLNPEARTVLFGSPLEETYIVITIE